MSMKKADIGGNIYDVITLEEYLRNPQMYDVQNAVTRGNGYVYPIRNITDIRPGMYCDQAMYVFKDPNLHESSDYGIHNIIDFGQARNLKEVIQAQQKLADAERTILTTVDNVFIPNIGANDSPEAAALKQAIIEKHIDISKYEARFGPNFNNDKRLLNKDTITLAKMKTMFDALDMEATLTIKDAGPDVPNPMNSVIVAKLNGEDAGYTVYSGVEKGEF